MPHIEHLAIWARDVDALAAFYEEYFGAIVGPRYENPAKGFSSRFLNFAGGARIELMASTQLALQPLQPGAQRLGLVHVAISVGSEHAVNSLTARLQQAGFLVLDGPRRTGDGYFESVVLDPEGNRIEITV
jgi:lactoylglutathione lyase